MTIDEMIAVLQAAEARKQIQYKSPLDGQWWSTDAPTWNFEEKPYRVKPEPPREWTVYVYSDGISSYDPTECVRRAKVREVL